jgi:chemotaxis protein MotB
LQDENQQLKLQLTRCEDEIGRLSKRNDQLKKTVADLRDNLATVQSMQEGLKKHQNLTTELQAELDAKRVTVEEVRVGAIGELILDEMIFQPGKAEITPEGRRLLKEIASILKDRKEYIRVDGHTDSDPITMSRELWKSNWELSAVRASRIVEHLEAYGIEPKRIAVGAFGQTRPVASNDSLEGKKANRRVEILIYDGLNMSSSE